MSKALPLFGDVAHAGVPESELSFGTRRFYPKEVRTVATAKKLSPKSGTSSCRCSMHKTAVLLHTRRRKGVLLFGVTLQGVLL